MRLGSRDLPGVSARRDELSPRRGRDVLDRARRRRCRLRSPAAPGRCSRPARAARAARRSGRRSSRDVDRELSRASTVVVVDRDLTTPSCQPFVRAYIVIVVETHAASAAGRARAARARCRRRRPSGSSVINRCAPPITTSCRSVPGIDRADAERLTGRASPELGSGTRPSGSARRAGTANYKFEKAGGSAPMPMSSC